MATNERTYKRGDRVVRIGEPDILGVVTETTSDYFPNDLTVRQDNGTTWGTEARYWAPSDAPLPRCYVCGTVGRLDCGSLNHGLLSPLVIR